MNTRLPLYRQEKDNSCALACLRMVLAAYSTHVEEHTLERQARTEAGGTDIGELERLAREYGLRAEVQEVTVEDLRRILTAGNLAMAYIDRAVFDLTPAQRRRHSLRAARIHVVVPTRVTSSYVTYHDPLPPGRMVRKSLHLFRLAYDRLGSRSVVCSKHGVG